MKLKLTFFLLANLFQSAIGNCAFCQSNYTQFVDPFIGTAGHGHTFPGATLPFGFVQLSPDTRIDGSWDGCSGYHYSDDRIYGFSHTHLSGTGVSDYGDILFMPMMGEPSLDNKIYSSTFSHDNESASPGFYSVKLDDGNILCEMTATTRVGFHKYTFSEGGAANIILDLTHRDKTLESSLKVVNSTRIEGMRRSEGWAKDQYIFFVAEFSKPFKNSISPEFAPYQIEATNIINAFQFDVKDGEAIYLKVAISAVNIPSASRNLLVELPGWDFEKVKADAETTWNKELSKIEVKSDDLEKMIVFYTALYHTMIAPNIFSDVDGYYRGRDNEIHQTDGWDYYTVFSLWDTYRAAHPLYTIIDQKRTLDFIKTFLAQYEQDGLLPVWELAANETECMIGYHSVSVIADAAIKGINQFDMELAFEAMKKSAESRERFGLGEYIDHGYLSMEDEHESVSKTLEYAYDDWCIAQMAKLLGKEEDYTTYIQRAQSWKNLFDSETGFMRPKKNGNWYSPFDPSEVNNNFTEANSWQYSFYVPQDISTLVEWMGGADAFEKKLDDLFNAPSEISGRDQPDISGMIGQYAHGNEPSHHMAYLYNYIGKPWKTQKIVHTILDSLYHTGPDGLCGNEDCGQMSAWYVMSAMGFYQVTPGNLTYAIGSPIFDWVTIHLESGKMFSVVAKNVSEENFYIKPDSSFLWESPAGYLNVFLTPFLLHSEIERGGHVTFQMGDQPYLNGKVVDWPAISDHQIFPSPTIASSEGRIFRDSTLISISTIDSSEKVWFFIYDYDNKFPEKRGGMYTRPFFITESSTITSYDFKSYDKIVSAHFQKLPHPEWKITINSTYNPQYTAGGDEGLIDGIRGDTEWRKGDWQGYQSQDFECIIDLGSEKEISKFTAGFLQDTRSWILMPTKVEFYTSTDGKKFKEALTIENTVKDSNYEVIAKDFSGTIKPKTARYIKVKAYSYGKLPEWHQGFPYDGDAFIFIDEIHIE